MNKLKKAIIPAAGLGTRFLPITKAVPKPMLSVLDKPTIQYIAEELKSIGIEEIVVVVSPDSQVIEKHFAENKVLEERLLADKKEKLYKIAMATRDFNIKFVEQKVANGLAGAILCAEPYVKDEPFALLLGDELIYAGENDTPCMKRLADIFEKTGKSVIATMEVFGDDVSKYGNIGFDSEEDGVMLVNRIVEKPSINEALSNNALIGRYVLSGEVMGKLKKLKPRNNEIYLTDVLDELAENKKLLASCFEGIRYDVGDKLGYIKANVEFALRSSEIGEETKEYIKELAKKI
ncbi:MAG: UTP--glucose-1-phosphate uridylyltransferase [Firmicutes bacterium]|nr:UTP--glucose-1-phosphate uridylyltransferase [Candidatus Caballimonas caccae]